MQLRGTRKWPATLALAAMLIAGSATAGNATDNKPALKDLLVDTRALAYAGPDASQTADPGAVTSPVEQCDPESADGHACLSIQVADAATTAQTLTEAGLNADGTPKASGNGGSQTQAIQPRPDLCQDIAQDGVWTVFSRTQACSNEILTLTVTRTIGGVTSTTGTATILAASYAYGSNNTRTWAHQVELKPLAITGEAAGATVSAWASCTITEGATGACGTEPATFPTQVLTVGGTATGEAFQSFTGTAASWGQGRWTYNFRIATGLQAQLYDWVLPIRCDAQVPGAGAGCIFDFFTPTIWYSRTELPRFTQHVENAQLSGLPGRTTPLHRLTDTTLTTANGNKACPSGASWLPRPSGHQCDEYPFRSTHEGASTGGGTARTQSWCQVTLPNTPSTGSLGYSICMIPKLQNSTAGGLLSGFYRTSRLLDNDPFYVRMKL